MERQDEVDLDSSWEDHRSTSDALRARCPVAAEDGGWVVLRHAEVVAAATDPATFSNTVTNRRVIPHGLDGAEHAAYRVVVERYMTDERVAAEEEPCRGHAADIIDALPRGETVKTLAGIGTPYAVRCQSSWLGWPASLERSLVEWVAENHEATRSGDREWTARVAAGFDAMIHGLLEVRRASGPGRGSGSGVGGVGRSVRHGDVAAGGGDGVGARTWSRGDVTTELMYDTVDGRPLTDAEIISILRNWTAGDLGSLAACVGVIVHFLAANPPIQESMRSSVASGDADVVTAAIDEILRIDDPFVSNRRVTTRPVGLGGVEMAGGDRVWLNWTAANRDPLVFADPDRFDPEANAAANLVFGIGPHVCPGRALTLMELRVLVEELLARTTWVELATDRPAVRQIPPVGGWARVPVVLR